MKHINHEERTEVYADAIETYGPVAQLVVALEELSECQKEICKVLRDKGDMKHLAEEVADAIIMLEQIRQIFGINEDVCSVMDEKIIRLQKRIADEKERRKANVYT